MILQSDARFASVVAEMAGAGKVRDEFWVSDREVTRGQFEAFMSDTNYRLLHEAEWEYACRAGTLTEYSSGDDESLLVGYCQMVPSKLTALVGQKLPNAWGLHDAHWPLPILRR